MLVSLAPPRLGQRRRTSKAAVLLTRSVVVMATAACRPSSGERPSVRASSGTPWVKASTRMRRPDDARGHEQHLRPPAAGGGILGFWEVLGAFGWTVRIALGDHYNAVGCNRRVAECG